MSFSLQHKAKISLGMKKKDYRNTDSKIFETGKSHMSSGNCFLFSRDIEHSETEHPKSYSYGLNAATFSHLNDLVRKVLMKKRKVFCLTFT